MKVLRGVHVNWCYPVGNVSLECDVNWALEIHNGVKQLNI